MTSNLKGLVGCLSHHLHGAVAYCGETTTGRTACFKRHPFKTMTLSISKLRGVVCTPVTPCCLLTVEQSFGF